MGVPHNLLVSDLILENYVCGRGFIREAIGRGEGGRELWNPFLFGGLPFLAAGQHSALYPLSVLFYILPLSKAYGSVTGSCSCSWPAGLCTSSPGPSG